MGRRKKSNTIEVTVSRTGGEAKRYTLNGDRTVEDALTAAGLRRKKSEVVHVNGEEIEDLDIELDDGDRVVLVKNVEGGLK